MTKRKGAANIGRIFLHFSVYVPPKKEPVQLMEAVAMAVMEEAVEAAAAVVMAVAVAAAVMEEAVEVAVMAVAVMAAADRLPVMTLDEQTAHKISKFHSIDAYITGVKWISCRISR